MTEGDEQHDAVVGSKLLKDDERWNDVTPIYHSDAENAVVPIAASEEFKDAFAYFRAIVQKDERSERALQLTTHCAELNSANYTVWQYRRNILQSLGSDLHQELKYCAAIIEDNPKNYQVWHHRRVLVEWTKDPSKEIDFTDGILRDDSKNYHAWQHRQWVVEHFKLWGEAELDYSARLLEEDQRNNSAWNYRYFIISNTTGFKGDILEREINATLALIAKAPHNESSWNYLSGILLDAGQSASQQVVEFCESLYSDKKRRSPYLLSFMVDTLSEKIDKGNDAKDNVERAVKLLDELQQIDPMRRKYWLYQKRSIENAVQSKIGA
uniref:Protein farnesyltransferase/geranylgeranyltransferase type-1 subunit alpha n=1 Tax=Plectus sambesii TaxID=2011161 RepID=A0A914XBY2_9BILA